MTQPSQLIDFSKYQPPGVYTNPLAGPQLAVNSQQPTAVGLFGLTIGYRTFTETLVIGSDTSDTTPAINRTLAQTGINLSTVVVRNISTGQAYSTPSDYTVVPTGGTTGTPNAQVTVCRVIGPGSNILPGQTVQVSYQYTDQTY